MSSTGQQGPALDQLFASPEDVQMLFQSSTTWEEAYGTISSAVASTYSARFPNLPPDHNAYDEIQKIWEEINMTGLGVQNVNIPFVSDGTETIYQVDTMNDLMNLPFELSEGDLAVLTDNMVKAGFLDQGQMPFGIVNAADQVFMTAWRNLLRSSIANGHGMSTELNNRIQSRVDEAIVRLEEGRPAQEAGLQATATSLLGRALTDEELQDAMNYITSKYSYLPEDERLLNPDSPLYDETLQAQNEYGALQEVAGEEMAVRREGATYLGLAQFDPRRDYGLSFTEREQFAQLDGPSSPTDLMAGENNG